MLWECAFAATVLAVMLGYAGADAAHGQRLSRTTLERIMCDCSITRVITDGPSNVLDVGPDGSVTNDQWAQQRAAHAQLNFISVKQRDGFSDALAFDQSPVEALQIANEKLFAGLLDLGVTARDHRGGSIDHHFAFGIAAQPRDFPVQLNPPGLLRVRIDQIEMRWSNSGRSRSRRRW